MLFSKDEIHPRYITSQSDRVNPGSFPALFYILPLKADKRCQVLEQLSRSSLEHSCGSTILNFYCEEQLNTCTCAWVCLSVCLSVRPSVRPSGRPSVRPSVSNRNFSLFEPLMTAYDNLWQLMTAFDSFWQLLTANNSLTAFSHCTLALNIGIAHRICTQVLHIGIAHRYCT